MRERQTDPQSFSTGFQRRRRTKKKPGAKEQTTSIARASSSWRNNTQTSLAVGVFGARISMATCKQAVVRVSRPSVAVGMAVPGHPPHRPVLAGTTAHGSYLGCDAARRSEEVA